MLASASSRSDFTAENLVCSAPKIWWTNYFDIRGKFYVAGNVEAMEPVCINKPCGVFWILHRGSNR